MAGKEAITITELSYYVGTRKRLLERLVTFEVIQPVRNEPEYYFSVDQIPRIKKILRLHDDLGVSWSSMSFVIDLLERIENLEKQIENRIR